MVAGLGRLLPVPALVALGLIFALAPARPAHAQSASCGPNSREIARHQADGTVTVECECDPGFVQQGQGCRLANGPAAVQSGSFQVKSLKVAGPVEVTLPGGRHAAAHSLEGFVLLNGTRIATGAGGSAELAFADGTAIALHENSQFVVEHYGADLPYLLRLEAGILRLIDAPLPNWLHPRRGDVRVAGFVVAVRGTDVTVELGTAGDGKVQLHSGAVDVITPAGRTVSLKAGEAIALPLQGEPGSPQPLAE